MLEELYEQFSPISLIICVILSFNQMKISSCLVPTFILCPFVLLYFVLAYKKNISDIVSTQKKKEKKVKRGTS